MKETTAHLISGTHWDREWYRPFQEFRYLLVKLMDQLLEMMEGSEEFRYFQLDGQTCLLEDYLEVRPERRERLGALIREGRILIGPWFTMPDLFCVGDEALVRNLLMGRRICGEWGVAPMAVGFVCDMFGHPSQMPQIFAGFGCRDAVLGRGTNESTTPAFFRWKAPDGSEVLVFKLQDAEGYGAFTLPRATRAGEDLFFMSRMKDFCRDLAAAGDDADAVTEVRERHFRIELERYVDHELGRCGERAPLCLMDALDHIAPSAEVGEAIRMLDDSYPGLAVRHSTLPEFFADVRKWGDVTAVRQGELREPGRERCNYLQLIPGCPSARVRLKQANDECQTLLERWADPLVALANLHGAGIPVKHLEIAWKHLLLNHAHDSICGCSIDQVHRDMGYRFDQVRVLGGQLRAQAVGALTAGCADLARGPDEFTLTLINPLPHARDEVVVFDVDLPTDYPAEFAESFFSTPIKAFTLEDAEGRPVGYQRLAVAPSTNERSRFAKFCFQSDGGFMRYTVAARVALPALGFTSLRVAPSPVPVRAVGSMRSGPLSAENAHLAIRIDPGGSVIIEDKHTGEIFRDLMMFEHGAETGDGWFHVSPVNDVQTLTGAGDAHVTVIHDGPELTAFRIEHELQVAACFDPHTQRFAERLGRIRIAVTIGLRRGARTVDVGVEVDNHAEDHRLRMLLPSDCCLAQSSLAHQPFDFVERPVAIDPQTASWREVELPEKPFLGIISVSHGRRGLALLSAAGPHEAAVLDDSRRTLAVTLLRAFRQTIATGGEPDGQEQGRISYRFVLMPLTGELPRAHALRELAALQAGIFTRQTGPRPSGFPPMSGEAPTVRSFIECLDGRLAVAAIKTPEQGDGLILRLWNPTGGHVTGRIRCDFAVRAVVPLALDEETPDPSWTACIDGREFSVDAAAHHIITLRVLVEDSL